MSEYEMIPRRRVGYGTGSLFDNLGGALSGSVDLNQVWTTGMNNVPYAQAVQYRDQARGKEAGLTPAAQANIVKWDDYVTRLTAVSQLTPQQYAAQKSKGTLLDQLTGKGGGFGGLLDSAKSLVGLGGSPAKPNVVTPTAPSGGILDAIFTPVGAVVTVIAAGAVGYFSLGKKKSRGRRR